MICVGLVALVVVAAGLAANNVVFTDGDETTLAMNIGTVVVSNDDQGTIVFDITIRPPQVLICPEDRLYVFIDADHTRATGDPQYAGADYYATYDANGNSSTGGPLQGFWRWTGSGWQQVGFPAGFGFSATEGTSTTPLRFKLTLPRGALANPSQINFWVWTRYPDNPNGSFPTGCRAPNAGENLNDFAPDLGSEPSPDNIRTWNYHVMVDPDGDNVSEEADNCRTVANGDQADQDRDGIGNACDADVDGDSRLNNADNCPTVSNAGQEDQDSDALGNACDPLPIDTTAPQVRALRASCDRPCPARSIVQLPYTFRVREDPADSRRPNVTEEIAVIRSSGRTRRLDAVHTGRKSNSSNQTTFTIRWRVPTNPIGWYTYCLQSSDLAGNTSKASCAAITFPAVEATPTITYSGEGRGLRIISLAVGGLPGNAVVSIDCRRRCSIHERARVSGSSYLSRKFGNRHVPLGAQIEVRVMRPRWSGDYDRLTLGARGLVRVDGCLPPGQRRLAARRFCG